VVEPTKAIASIPMLTTRRTSILQDESKAILTYNYIIFIIFSYLIFLEKSSRSATTIPATKARAEGRSIKGPT